MDSLLEQLRELWAERRRVGLVALGVAWGTLSLTLLVAFGNSFVVATNQTIKNFGVDLLRVGGGSTTRAFEGLPAGRFIALQPQDLDLLKRGVPEAQSIEVEYSSGLSNPIEFGPNRINVPMSGCGPAYRDIRGMIPEPGGRFLNQLDVDQHRRVCFLGDETKQRLFGDADAIGAEVILRGVPFTVVGVRRAAETVSNYNGRDRDKVAIPHTTFRDLLGWGRISHLMVKLRAPELKQQALTSIYQTLAARYRFDPADEDALDIQDYLAMQDMIQGMLDGNRYFNAIVGFFSLLVAMLGVMNVMYVMVEERTREIGVRMALGARPLDIAFERLTEGIIVTLIGGVLGMIACVGLFALLNLMPLEMEARAYLGYPRLSIGLAGLVIMLLGIAGSLAGWFPARRAAALDPVQSLREE
jgi:putative ABC transport system permease protein